jgi:uncharacterized protein YchJ
MKIAFRIVLLAVVAALGFWLWTVFFPGPEKLILRKMASLATTSTFNASDSPVMRAVKVGNLIGYFAVDAEIIVDVPELGAHTVSGRDEIRDAARAVFAGLATLNVEFLDVTVRLGTDKQTATVTCTARVSAGDKKNYGVEEMRFQLKKIDGTWLITRAETVKTLS